MLFVTEIFLIFFLTVHLGYWLLPGRFRKSFLLLASFFFYATWSFPFAIHLIAVVAVNYAVMEIWRFRKSNYLFGALQAGNLLNIAFFKYFYFFADIIGMVTGLDFLRQPQLLQSHRMTGTEILLPLAISFYTFQIMAYGIDIRRGVYDRKHSFSDVLLFIFFFPQLIAGPIMRSEDLLPQIARLKEEEKNPDPDSLKAGIWLILLGVVKKVIVADQLLAYAAPVIGGKGDMGPLAFSTPEVWGAMLASILMLYTDFSAYTDLARGFGATLGFSIPINFKAPFFMVSISDFWRRWHLTFSLWIRDYIFIPLGGSRVGEARAYFNLIVTFFLGGLWHGASWSFVLWGTTMGVYHAFESYMVKRGIPEWPEKWRYRFLRLGTSWFALILSGTLFFSSGMGWTGDILYRMFAYVPVSESRFHTGDSMVLFASILAVLFFHWIEEKPQRFVRFRSQENWLLPVASFLVILAVTQFSGAQKDFFYFQF